MIEQIKLVARWGDRQETVDACALRALRCLRKMCECDEIFTESWFEGGMSLAQALANPVDLTRDSLRRNLETGRSRRDSDRSVIESLGFSIGLWNGLSDEQGPAHVTIFCGAYPDPSVLPGPNEVIVDLPYEGPASARVLRADKLFQIAAVLVESWDPDWVCASTYQVYEAVYGQGPYRGQQAGWLTYVSGRYGPLPPMPPDCSVARLGSAGSLITVTSITRLTASNPEHVASVRRLSDALSAAELLAPVPPATA